MGVKAELLRVTILMISINDPSFTQPGWSCKMEGKKDELNLGTYFGGTGGRGGGLSESRPAILNCAVGRILLNGHREERKKKEKEKE